MFLICDFDLARGFSRPTAVNLLDAAEKLKQLVNKASETSDEAKTVFEVNF